MPVTILATRKTGDEGSTFPDESFSSRFPTGINTCYTALDDGFEHEVELQVKNDPICQNALERLSAWYHRDQILATRFPALSG